MRKTLIVMALGSTLVAGVIGAAPASASTTAPQIAPTSTWANNYHYATKCVQVALNAHYGMSLTVDGYYGPKSQSAVKQLQRDAHLTVDGYVGRQTGSLIMSTLDKIGHHSDCYPVVPTLN